MDHLLLKNKSLELILGMGCCKMTAKLSIPQFGATNEAIWEDCNIFGVN